MNIHQFYKKFTSYFCHLNTTMSNNIIPLSQASTETHAFQNSLQFQGLTKSCAIDKDAYNQLLSQPGVAEIRTYFSLNNNNTLSIVVVGVDNNGNDMTNGIILGESKHCPYYCPPNSPLM
jgi:hypothetical protein